MPREFQEVTGTASRDEGLHTCDVLVATIPKRETHDVLKLLSTQLPLEAHGLSHLKRVRKMEGDDGRLQIILAPPESISSPKSQSVGSPSQDTGRTRLDELCRGARVVPVPACAPPDRDRLESWSAVWPVSLRKRPTEPRVLDAREKDRMESCIQLALHYYGSTASSGDDLSCPFSGAVLVDPDANTVLAVAGSDAASEAESTSGPDSAAKFPLQHAPMRLIADLATQDTSGTGRQAAPIAALLVPEGAQVKLHDNVSTQEQPAKRQRQASGVLMPEPITNMTTAPGSVCTSSTSVPYIGVGLEVYCAVEPCLMCAMALVHSRIARVVYRLPLQAGGGLGSAACLQNVKSLNHKLDVWKCGDCVEP